MHLMAKHMFPQDYDFYIVNDGIDRRSSMLRTGRHRRRSSAAVVQVDQAKRKEAMAEQHEGNEKRKLEEDDEDESMQENSARQQKEVQGKPAAARTDAGSEGSVDDLVSGMSALKFIPPSVRFGRGRGKGRGGFSKT